MKWLIHVEPSKHKLKKSTISLLEVSAQLALKESKKIKRGEINLYFVTPAQVTKLNKTYRKKSKATDVLSFSNRENKLFPAITPVLGEIFICIAVIKRQARENRISFEEELIRMTAHGVLHLLGYDHEGSERKAKKMFKIQETIVARVLNQKVKPFPILPE